MKISIYCKSYKSNARNNINLLKLLLVSSSYYEDCYIIDLDNNKYRIESNTSCIYIINPEDTSLQDILEKLHKFIHDNDTYRRIYVVSTILDKELALNIKRYTEITYNNRFFTFYNAISFNTIFSDTLIKDVYRTSLNYKKRYEKNRRKKHN